jgi:rRNA maturation protein Rpf1
VLKGQVKIAGRDFDVYIADSGYNDADFSNDGIFIEFDRDERVTREELVAHDEFLEHTGGRFQFKIQR